MKFFSKKGWFSLFIFLLLSTTSCSYTEDINSLKNRVSELESAVLDLQEAFKEGKFISSLEPITDPYEGFLITFSDRSSIVLRQGKDGNEGVTPLIKIDNDGYWVVSYNNKETYQLIRDENNEPILAIGRTGNPGISVKVSVEKGYFVFQLYSPDDPDTIIETIPTSYSVNPANILKSVVEDANNGVITLTMEDGSEFLFNLDVIFPTSIVLLTDHIELFRNNPSSSFEFRINPSNAFVNWVYEGENPNIQLDKISSSRAGDSQSYVTVPGHYRITAVTPSVNENGERKVGQYTVKVESNDSNVEGEDVVALVITTKDGRGNNIQITSSLMSIAYDTRPQIYNLTVGGIEAIRTDSETFYVKIPYTVDTSNLPFECESNSQLTVNGVTSPSNINLSKPVRIEATLNDVSKVYTLIGYYSELPILYIDTPSPILSKDEWIKKSSIIVANAGEYNTQFQEVQMKGRGNSTWQQPKKPYAIKLDKKAELLGLPKHKRWVLLANYIDKTNLRTEASMFLGRQSRLDYSPRTKFVEVVLNGEFLGLYQLTEQLKIDENRVNVNEDGFLLEVDSRAGQDPDDIYFSVENIPNPVVIKDPDLNYDSEEVEFIKNYLTSVSTAISKLDTDANSAEFEELIDLDSFIDWYLVNEVTRNNDACFWSSCYMNLKRGGKLKMGPLWDFDLAIGNTIDNGSDNPEGFWLKITIPWYISLFKNEKFVEKLKYNFNQIYNTRFGWYDYIRLNRDDIREAYFGNVVKWQLWQSKTDQNMINIAFNNEVENMIGWLETRLNWMKAEFDKI
ncbi:MAG: CotH kinase family protein [Muribaculaceae bacterium]|nr:CotH kinase family protein [Muribaculaceae bacterium]